MCDTIAKLNPFATRFVAPGRLPFLSSSEQFQQTLVQRLASLKFRAAIVGPHGAGKSTLLCALDEWLSEIRLPVNRLEYHLKSKTWFVMSANHKRAELRCQLQQGKINLIDGFERLSAWQRWRLLRRRLPNETGLVVTLHAPARIPTLVSLQPSLEDLERVLDQIKQQLETEWAQSGNREAASQTLSSYRHWRRRWTTNQLTQIFTKHGGNIREILFEFYDDWESYQRGYHSQSIPS